MDRSYAVLQAIYGVFNIGKILLQNSMAFFRRTLYVFTTLYGVYLHYKILRRTIYCIIFNLIGRRTITLDGLACRQGCSVLIFFSVCAYMHLHEKSGVFRGKNGYFSSCFSRSTKQNPPEFCCPFYYS